MIDAIVIHKIGRLFKRNNLMSGFFLRLNRMLNSCHVHPQCQLGKGFQFVHGGIGVVINRNVKFGENVRVYQNVTIGNDSSGGVPSIGNNVTIFANSVVVGEIFVADNSVIGAQSFVKQNIPEGTVWAGAPAKQIGVVKEQKNH